MGEEITVNEKSNQTEKMQKQFRFFGPATFLYALLYAFCMFKNGSGITFPFFITGSLLYLCFCLSKLEISLKKGSGFYMVAMMLLAVSTFCTDDFRIINLNKTGIFLLMMSLLLKQFYDTSEWKLGKYFSSIFLMVFGSVGEIHRPFVDAAAYYREHKSESARGEKKKIGWYVLLGIAVSLPLLLIVLLLLSSADAVFYQLAKDFFDWLQPAESAADVVNVLFRIGFIFFASYQLLAYLCKHSIKEQVKDKRNGEPVLAITVTGLLSAIYLLFSGIQIFGLFLGKLQLPEGYTYAQYAREGFFQLLAVSIINLAIVLFTMSFFKENKVLKIILTVMSCCTFIMIVSSAVRMIIYIRYYYLTFLRIFVLWALAVLLVLFVGVVIGIYREKFPLFKYSVVVVTGFYLLLSYSHPDYIIAKVNVANAPHWEYCYEGFEDEWSEEAELTNEEFFLGGYYTDYRYLSNLSADAAPVLASYMEELGYDMEAYLSEDILSEKDWPGRNRISGFGYYYMDKMQRKLKDFSFRTYNISRHMAKISFNVPVLMAYEKE